MTLELDDLDTLKDAAIKKFDDCVAHGSPDESLDREVAQLQAELEQIYRMVVLLQKNEPDIERVAEIWGKMVAICDEFARRLSSRPGKGRLPRFARPHPGYSQRRRRTPPTSQLRMIPVEQIARLAELYDRYNNALDPLSEDCKEAKLRFDALSEGLHGTRAANVKFLDFRFELVRQCREYLRKNRPG